ncbi:hypothetical protein [uncultured Megasphaera sp.]|uniref:hypothetical protein n=1 Tax=uncultured Megasphaera sp. TaxID=165188 RepID=UPI00265B49C3|nr:hypothetical protein [uncultured Megasphaera sp.]
MGNVIAVIWDFDKTLISGYMQEPIFEAYGVDGEAFWKEVDSLPAMYSKRHIQSRSDLSECLSAVYAAGHFQRAE